MKKYLSLSILIAFAIVFNVNAQNNTYNMVIKMANGTTITIGPNDIENIAFKDGEVTVSGQRLEEFMNSLETVNENKVNTKDFDAFYKKVREQLDDVEKKIASLSNSSNDEYIKSLQQSMIIIQNSLDQAKTDAATAHATFATQKALEDAIANIEAKGSGATKEDVRSLMAALQDQKTSLEAAIAATKSETQTANATLNTKLTELQTLVGNNKTDLANAIKAAVSDSKTYADGISAEALKKAQEYANAAATEAAAKAKTEVLEEVKALIDVITAGNPSNAEEIAQKASELAAKIDAVDESFNKLIAAEKEERVNALLAVNTQIVNHSLQIAALEKKVAAILSK